MTTSTSRPQPSVLLIDDDELNAGVIVVDPYLTSEVAHVTAVLIKTRRSQSPASAI